ncbi:ArsR/SmtB family transcription factor [Sedimentitalea sp. XS_ASV28]|uniref:ArsR/SmtB family transcription factor n=1 Tax=Sedimentitalea sp. XS_ASV28 TaxID=3241296 RepID=UPI003511046A
MDTLTTENDLCTFPCFDRERVEAAKRVVSAEETVLPALVDLYKLLGNGTRLKILLALRQGELCVCDMAHVLGLSVPATSHQLKLLRDHGWVRMRNDGKMVYYELNDSGLRDALEGDLALLKSRLG